MAAAALNPDLEFLLLWLMYARRAWKNNANKANKNKISIGLFSPQSLCALVKYQQLSHF